jgi:hypothetical protein
MSNAPENNIKEAQERMNAKRRDALPTADQSVSCNHCGGECSWDDGYACKPCKLVFDLDDETTEREDDGEPLCAAEPAPDRAKFWAASDMKLWPCNLTAGHETAEHHHPMTIEEPAA